MTIFWYWGPINRFNLTTLLFLSKARTMISNAIYRGLCVCVCVCVCVSVWVCDWFEGRRDFVWVCVCVTDLRGDGILCECVRVSLIWGERWFCLFHKKEVKYHLKCTSQELKRWFIILSWYLSNPTFPLVDDWHYIPT